MPGYKTHLVGGGVLFATIAYLSPLSKYPTVWTPAFAAVCFCLCLLGSLFPDIDIKSKGQMVFYKLLAMAIGFAIFSKEWETLSVLSLLSTIPLMLRHRGATHHPWFLILLAFTLAFLLNRHAGIDTKYTTIMAFFFGVGAFSHIILDRGVAAVTRQLLGR